MSFIKLGNGADDKEVALMTKVFQDIGVMLQEEGIDFEVQQTGDGWQLETTFVIDFDGWDSRSLHPDHAIY